ncbi:predicted GPI-anchored protein 58 [Thrips palmi]|uniref:Predicted GPI-anchored protein 58 n=1 Tax=Thrips palmi TaxID=161013 RepID=A0A6P8Y9F4_THRPL|nr:predicted GPI-anchored protein 58 [Thrips palmi]
MSSRPSPAQPLVVPRSMIAGCLWTLVAPAGYNVSAAVAMGAWGRGGRGVVHLYAQTEAGDLSPVFSLHAPAQSSAEVHTRSSVAVLSTALPASATFTLRVSLTLASTSSWSSGAAAGAALADTLQPPAPTRPWPSSPPTWNPALPYPASLGHVDAETVDLTHQQQHQTANCVVAGPARPVGQGAADEGHPARPPAGANVTADEQPPLPASKPSTTTSRPSTTTTSRPSTAKPAATTARDKATTAAPATTPTTPAKAPSAAPTPSPATTKKPGR